MPVPARARSPTRTTVKGRAWAGTAMLGTGTVSLGTGTYRSRGEGTCVISESFRLFTDFWGGVPKPSTVLYRKQTACLFPQFPCLSCRPSGPPRPARNLGCKLRKHHALYRLAAWFRGVRLTGR